jgi:hypothetical protein
MTTSHRVKAAARRLQAAEGIPYAEARRRVLDGPTNTLPAEPPPSPPAPQPDPVRPHRHLGSLYMGGLNEDRVEFCYRCSPPELRDRVAAVDQAARQMRIVAPNPNAMYGWEDMAWPYGPNIDLDSREALVAWAGPLGLRESSTSRKCLHWLRGRHCPRNSSYGACGGTVPGADHVSTWNHGPGANPAVLVSQPYHLADEDRAELAELAKNPDLVVEIDEDGGWYGARTIWVAIWRADQHPTSTR